MSAGNVLDELDRANASVESGRELTLDRLDLTVRTLSGAVVSTSPSAGIGYSTGAGGAVTQATNKTTGVTLSKICGRITMNNASLAAGAEAVFVVTNTAIAATDVVIVNVVGGVTNQEDYRSFAQTIAAGTFEIAVTNETAGALGEAVVLNFAIIKAVIS